MDYLLANFSFGNGPYLKTTALALAINKELRGRGKNPLGIIVPWVYGETQRRIMLEEFQSWSDEEQSLIYLDSHLGSLLKEIFYGNGTFNESLARWTGSHKKIADEMKRCLNNSWTLESLKGGRQKVKGQKIALELTRNPRVSLELAPGFEMTFGSTHEIFQEALKVSSQKINLDPALVKKAAALAQKVDEGSRRRYVSEPGTFSYNAKRRPLDQKETAVPPAVSLKRGKPPDISREGIYVTVSGVPGLERLYQETKKLGLTVYTNNTEAIPGSTHAAPDAIGHPKIKLHFGRCGWGAIGLSQIKEIPIVSPPHDPSDDPEIYFNILSVESLGLGVIWRGQSLKELIETTSKLKDRIREYNSALKKRFGTLDGYAYTAKMILKELDV